MSDELEEFSAIKYYNKTIEGKYFPNILKEYILDIQNEIIINARSSLGCIFVVDKAFESRIIEHFERLGFRLIKMFDLYTAGSNLLEVRYYITWDVKLTEFELDIKQK